MPLITRSKLCALKDLTDTAQAEEADNNGEASDNNGEQLHTPEQQTQGAKHRRRSQLTIWLKLECMRLRLAIGNSL